MEREERCGVAISEAAAGLAAAGRGGAAPTAARRRAQRRRQGSLPTRGVRGASGRRGSRGSAVPAAVARRGSQRLLGRGGGGWESWWWLIPATVLASRGCSYSEKQVQDHMKTTEAWESAKNDDDNIQLVKRVDTSHIVLM
ncbi:uncharacterized protein LOC107305218 [Oryza brachyantha]|uniref:uncharacterized protein LOC107305218 n=1 Tax=Oryza brachyantha TaxID=4533 RepID=UPI001ADAE87B|nr:uncharacterized protein LOC107305218 [Oryza brachyantha]